MDLLHERLTIERKRPKEWEQVFLHLLEDCPVQKPIGILGQDQLFISLEREKEKIPWPSCCYFPPFKLNPGPFSNLKFCLCFQSLGGKGLTKMGEKATAERERRSRKYEAKKGWLLLQKWSWLGLLFPYFSLSVVVVLPLRFSRVHHNSSSCAQGHGTSVECQASMAHTHVRFFSKWKKVLFHCFSGSL